MLYHEVPLHNILANMWCVMSAIRIIGFFKPKPHHFKLLC